MTLAHAAALAALLALLAACSTAPRLPPQPPQQPRDGPGLRIPPGLEQVPDAQPRLEPLRSGGPNKPYEVGGRWYAPAADDVAWRETGLASWYGARFHGRPTALGEPYDMFAMTAAHKTMPLPSYVRVRNPANGREVILRINDRGPFVDGRVIDLSYTAALKLGLLAGVAVVELERITQAQIRSGLWRRGGAGPQPLPAAADPLRDLLIDRGLLPPRSSPPVSSPLSDLP